MDATIMQDDGYRFLYTLPFSENVVLIEDTHYSDGPAIAAEKYGDEILRYADSEGWRIMDLLRQLHADGVAILLVSHQVAMLRELVEHVLWIERGQVREGRPEELLSAERLERLFDDEVQSERARPRRES